MLPLVRILLCSLATVSLLVPSSLRAQDEGNDARPYTRWWWFADDIRPGDVRAQLDWLKHAGFGGVEIAFVYPLHGDTAAARLEWLSPEWSRVVADAAGYCDSIGLGCDLTFGTLWPFGDSRVPQEDGARVFADSASPKRMRLTWEHPVRGRVVNHLDRQAFERYAARMFEAMDPALRDARDDRPRHLFCDSWEVETRGLWTPGFDTLFLAAHGYDIRPLMDSLFVPGFEGAFHDYMKSVSRLVLNAFYTPFTAAAHGRGARSRAQCGGAPVDLLAAFGRTDVPESEAILFDPAFSRIPASAAALYAKPLVSAETFTCLYGWKGWPGPGPRQGEEHVTDLKLLADALFAQGVNWIVWHGMPYNPPGRDEHFYASVHVGPRAALAPRLPEFNAYLSEISAAMRRGTPYGDVAVYLPLEDAWMDVELPDSLKFPWAWGAYELRYQRLPASLKGYQPLWINAEALRSGRVREGRLIAGDAAVRTLVVDARFLDRETVEAIIARAEEGLTVCLLRKPKEPGHRASEPSRVASYHALIDRLYALPSVHTGLAPLGALVPLLRAVEDGREEDHSRENAGPAWMGVPDFRCRVDGGTVVLFFPHPASAELRYPLRYGQADEAGRESRDLVLHWQGRDIPLRLDFAPGMSLLVEVGADGIPRINPYILASP
ncbi:MAG: hypothetical protein KFF77_09035 [Bacteroidetes bacterium]|nr:hypothetical protein [Bacteroidota bacterium]